MSPLSLREDIIPEVEAFVADRGWGTMTVTFQDGKIEQVDVLRSYRLPDQLRYERRRRGLTPRGDRPAPPPAPAAEIDPGIRVRTW